MVDGTWGHFQGNKDRQKLLKSKQRKEQKRRRQTGYFFKKKTLEFKKVDPETLDAIKKDIQNKAARQCRKEIVILLIAVVLIMIAGIWFFNMLFST